MRNRGFYKVRRFAGDQAWSVAEFDGQCWATCGDLPALTDADFAEIGDQVDLPSDAPAPIKTSPEA